jgi:hypothetical protein
MEPSDVCGVVTTGRRRLIFGWPIFETLPARLGAVMLGTVIAVILILALIGAIPSWPYSRSWGYGPSGVAGVLLVILIVLALSHSYPFGV